MCKYLIENKISMEISNWCRESLCEKVDVITVGFGGIIVIFRSDMDKAHFALRFGEWCKEVDCR